MPIQTTLAVLSIMTVGIMAIVAVALGGTAAIIVGLAALPSFPLAIWAAARQETRGSR